MSPPASVKLAVFGQPVAHSLSPHIHRLFGEQLGMVVEYEAIESSPEALHDRLAEFRGQGGHGANLTVPLKQAGLKLCAQIEADARRARAINTLKAVESGWHGFNTDGAGLIDDFSRLGIGLEDRRVLIAGAGGAVAGTLGALIDAGAQRICLLNRSLERAERLADKFAHRGDVRAASFEQGPQAGDFDLIIQSTSAGHQGALPLLNRSWLARDAVAYDLNYGPAHSGFANWCQAHDIPCHDGLGMLVSQAILAFEIWTSRKPEAAPVLQSLRSTV